MKKILTFLFVFSILFCNESYTQEDGNYKLTISFDRIYNSGNDMRHTDFEVFSINQNELETSIAKWAGGEVNERASLPPPKPIIRIFSAQESPYKLRFWGKRTWGTLFGSNSRSGEEWVTLPRERTHIQLSLSKGDRGNDFFPSLSTTISIELVPSSIKLHYFINEGEGTEAPSSLLKLLPNEDVITLKATKGFIERTYKWQYQVVGDATWHDMPNKVRYREGRSVVTFRGEDLFDKLTFERLINQGRKIQVRINAMTDRARTEIQYEKLILTPTYSAPHILASETTQEQCNLSGDASVRFTLDRPLLDGESLSLFINGSASGVSSNITLDANNSFTVEGLSAGSYTFALRGAYKGFTTYTGAPNHQKSLTITPRPVITHSFTKSDINCHAGSDGSITLTAQGGDGAVYCKAL